MTGYLDEAQIEIVTVDYFRELGYEYIHGPVIAPFNERVNLSVRQNQRLVGLRDTLLPKLLRGEIELPEAKAIAVEVKK